MDLENIGLVNQCWPHQLRIGTARMKLGGGTEDDRQRRETEDRTITGTKYRYVKKIYLCLKS